MFTQFTLFSGKNSPRPHQVTGEVCPRQNPLPDPAQYGLPSRAQNPIQNLVQKLLQKFLQRLVANCQGSATVEIALLMPAVLALLAAILTLVSAGVTQIQVTEAARAGARAAALGQSTAQITAVVRQAGPALAQVNVSSSDTWTVVYVQQDLPGFLGWAGLTAQGQARLPHEPGGQ